jgi:hypothetical protein
MAAGTLADIDQPGEFMNQNKTTLLFAGVAAVALLLAWEPWRSRPEPVTLAAGVGAALFPDFKDPLASANLSILRHDENTGEPLEFSITRAQKGRWSIPSHSNYPADAKEHLAEAGTALREVKILDVVSQQRADHELYGVVEPSRNSLKAADKTVGTRITIRDAGDKVLADVVIGKEVKEQSGQRYVRRPGQDVVYRAKVAVDKFSTKFGDWIEKDLLKLNGFDIRQVYLNDYSARAHADGRLEALTRGQLKLSFNDEKSTWTLDEATTFDEQQQPQPAPLKDDEELNLDKLNGLKNALDDLEIVDVERKPAGMSADLRADADFLQKRAALQSLDARGFIPALTPENKVEIYSREGEVICTMKDGVEYVLRFGGVAASSPTEGATPKADDQKPADPPKDRKLNRYLFVMARLNPERIPQPELQPLPGDEPENKPAEGAAATPGETPPAGEGEATKSGETPPAGEGEAAKSGETPPAGEPVDEVPRKDGDPFPQPEAPKSSEEAGRAASASQANAQEPAPVADEPAANPPATGDSPAKQPADQPAAAPPANDKAAQDAQRAAIEKENKRKQQEYDDKIKAANDRVKELNDRFADWYYLISDEVYQKIHLGRTDVVKQKMKEPGKGDGIGDLNELEKGLPKPPATDAPK